MQLLESAMAFAVVMILLSTIVTGIVELLVRIFGMREKNLRNTVTSLFENVVWPRFEAKMIEAGRDEKTVFANFLRGLTANPAYLRKERKKEGQTSAATVDGQKRLLHRDSIDVLTPIAFAQRLARTDVGKAIIAEGKDEIEPLVQDFVRTFDRYGRAASEVFRKNARAVAIGVGIVLALATNIDVSRLFTTLMNNPELRKSLIEQSEEAAKANKEAADRLQEILDTLEPRVEAQEPKSEPAATETASQPGGSAEEGVGSGEDEFKTIEQKIAEIKSGIGTLESKGLPIGYTFYPYCSEGPQGDQACRDSVDAVERAAKILRWLFFTVLAGVLIGLGGPFWFRVFSSLSQVFQVLRSVGVGTRPKQAKPEELETTQGVEDSIKPDSVLNAFEVAAHVHGKSASPSG